MYSLYLYTCIITAFISCYSSLQIPGIPNVDSINTIYKRKTVGPCTACRSLVKSFLAALKETTRESFAGGDADWEREKLGTYENSELRFIEIQEKLCTDINIGKEQCYNLAEEYESDLEDWFYKKRKEDADLYDSFCINNLKVCCPNNTFGPNCIPCPGGVEKPCGGHGKCVKGGTREEPASCECDDGYTGELCEKCSKGYYEEMDTPSLSCKICDKSCKDHCRGPGPKNCEVCTSGYYFLPNEGCVEKSEAKIISNQSDNNERTSSETNNESNKLKVSSKFDDSNINNHHSEF